MSSVSRVSIPNSVKRTIQNIKEIAGNHSDEEIYAMLKECSMDPNETVQKLLFQDTFHEVKRKRDKRKESNREAADTKWRPGSQGRGGRAGRGNYTSRYASHDGGAGRTMGAGKENGISQGRDKDIIFSSHSPLDADCKAASAEQESTASMSRSIANMPNEPIKAEHLSTDETTYNTGPSAEETSVEIKKNGVSSVQEKLFLSNTGLGSSSITIDSAGVYASAPDPVLIPSLDEHSPELVGNINHEVGILPSAGETIADRVISHDVGSDLLFLSENSASGKNHSLVNGRVQGNLLEVEEIQVPDTYQPATSTAIVGTSGSRPSSNYNNRPLHASGPFKAAPAKEWKPKSTNVNTAPNSDTRSSSDVDLNKGEAEESVSCLLPASDSKVSDISIEVMKLEDLHISETQHVIIPVHLQVPESERFGLSFGSFDSNFGLSMRLKSEPENTKCSEEPSESSGEHEENVDQLPSSDRDEFSVAQEKTFSDDQQKMSEIHSSSVSDIPSNISPTADYDQSKTEVYVATEGSQRSVMHTAPVYSNFGFVPQMLGSPYATFDGAELQARDAARLQNFVVQQPFDPSSNYYASIYRPTADGDGRFSPFLAPGTAPKYNGNIAVLPAQSGQSPQECVNSLVLSSTTPTPTVTQTTGLLQTSLAASQQPVPVFRQPAGVHISHYPPNYAPYNQYISPFYIPPPAAIHHFLGNASVFPQQPPSGSLYPPPTATAGTTPVKYPVSQYKTVGNTGPTGQGTYVVNPAGYNSAVSGGNSTGSDDLSSSQFKENNVFITGQQTEGSAVWISPPGRDISTMQAGPFYNVSPHGQPVAFAPTQAGHAAAFTGVYHPTQSVAGGSVHPLLQQSQAMVGASEIVGPPAGVYQQPQRSSQINWFNNF